MRHKKVPLFSQVAQLRGRGRTGDSLAPKFVPVTTGMTLCPARALASSLEQ